MKKKQLIDIKWNFHLLLKPEWIDLNFHNKIFLNIVLKLVRIFIMKLFITIIIDNKREVSCKYRKQFIRGTFLAINFLFFFNSNFIFDIIKYFIEKIKRK